MLAIKTILHPTDFSESSSCALDLACGLASDYGASLVIIHVIATPITLFGGVVLPNADSGVVGIEDQLQKLEISDRSIDVIRRVEEGNPAVEILNMAQLCQADLIVMGSHGRRGLTRLFMGSVAEAVMRKATCPVLTVSTPAPCRSARDDLLSNQVAHV